MNTILTIGVLSLLIICFVSATFLELKRDRNSLRSLTRILPLAVAGGASVFLLIPLTFYLGSINVSSELLSKTMSVAACLVASSGFICRYKSRFATVLIVFGGMVLTFLWAFNRVI
jgi:hypothetical protein